MFCGFFIRKRSQTTKSWYVLNSRKVDSLFRSVSVLFYLNVYVNQCTWINVKQQTVAISINKWQMFLWTFFFRSLARSLYLFVVYEFISVSFRHRQIQNRIQMEFNTLNGLFHVFGYHTTPLNGRTFQVNRAVHIRKCFEGENRSVNISRKSKWVENRTL